MNSTWALITTYFLIILGLMCLLVLVGTATFGLYLLFHYLYKKIVFDHLHGAE